MNKTQHRPKWFGSSALVCKFIVALALATTLPAVAQTNFTTLASNCAWTWYNDPRALFHNGQFYFGYNRSDGKTVLSTLNLATGVSTNLWVSGFTQVDDHNVPGLLAKQDGTLLAVYSRHGADQYFAYRRSLTTNPVAGSDWAAEQQIPNSGAGVSYSNPYQLSSEGGKIYNFCRDVNWNPTIFTSTDGGSNWSTPQWFIRTGTGGSTRPYVKYASDYQSRIDVLYTDGHPRDVTNSLYHLYYQSNALYKTDGSLLKNYAGLPLLHDSGERGSVIYQYSDAAQSDPNQWIPTGRAWCWEIAYQTNSAPVCVFTVQCDHVTGANWFDDRIYYYYARWTGTAWQKRFIAQAGRPLYTPEEDYAGGICIDPKNPDVIYLSSNAQNPFDLSSTTNVPLNANQRYELWRGVTTDGGLNFTWTPVTTNSAMDNLRPYVSRRNGGEPSVIWFRGSYTTYQNYSCNAVGLFTTAVPPPPPPNTNTSLITLKTDDASGTTSLTGSTNWSDNLPPSSANDYSTAGFLLRTPNVSGTTIFQGNSLTIDGGRFIGKFPTGTTGTITVNNLILNGGLVDEANGNTSTFNLVGNINVTAASSLGAQATTAANAETLNLTATINGSAGLTIGDPNLNSGKDNGTVRLSAANPYSGIITVTNGASIWSATSRLLQLNHADAVSNATLNLRATIANPISFASGITTFNVGGLMGASTQALTNTAGAAVTLSIGGNNSSSAFGGKLTGIGALTKAGNGTLTLSGTNTYTGITTVSNGILVNNGLFSVSPVTVVANGTLRGVGIFSSAVTNNGTLAPGTLASLGALTISNTLTLGATSTNIFRLDVGAVTNDSIAGLTTVNYGGTLIVTNFNGALALGETFQLFKAGVYNGAFSNLTLPVLAGGRAWTNRLNVDGSLAIYSANPPWLSCQITNGNSLRFSWPNGYASYRLQSQTNSLNSGLGTNWTDVSGATSSPVLIPINNANGSVFFRMVSP